MMIPMFRERSRIMRRTRAGWRRSKYHLMKPAIAILFFLGLQCDSIRVRYTIG